MSKGWGLGSCSVRSGKIGHVTPCLVAQEMQHDLEEHERLCGNRSFFEKHPSSTVWSYEYIEAAVKAGYIKGITTKTYGPS